MGSFILKFSVIRLIKLDIWGKIKEADTSSTIRQCRTCSPVLKASTVTDEDRNELRRPISDDNKRTSRYAELSTVGRILTHCDNQYNPKEFYLARKR